MDKIMIKLTPEGEQKLKASSNSWGGGAHFPKYIRASGTRKIEMIKLVGKTSGYSRKEINLLMGLDNPHRGTNADLFQQLTWTGIIRFEPGFGYVPGPHYPF